MLAQDGDLLLRAKKTSVIIVHRGLFFQASSSLASAHDFPIPSEAGHRRVSQMLNSTCVPATGTNFIPKLFCHGCSLVAFSSTLGARSSRSAARRSSFSRLQCCLALTAPKAWSLEARLPGT